MMDSLEWLISIRPKVIKFLKHQKGKTQGYYKYSYSGDLFSEETHWGLTSAVFAAKSYYMLNALEPKTAKDISRFIKSFEVAKTGEIYDPLILRRSLIPNMLVALYQRDLKRLIWGREMVKRAETRQSFAALLSLGDRPSYPYREIPSTVEGIEAYFKKLNWKLPWNAGSHLSHLIFFLYQNQKHFNLYGDNYEKLIAKVLESLEMKQSSEDGCWYDGELTDHIQKINGAMKVLTGLVILEDYRPKHIDRIIDTCLPHQNDEGACNSFDVLYVLYVCSRWTDYRQKDIKSFAMNKIAQYREYFFEDKGGFSFHKNKANHRFYGAKISLGKNEPDIHGTVLYLWGLTLISKILDVDDKLFKAPIT